MHTRELRLFLEALDWVHQTVTEVHVVKFNAHKNSTPFALFILSRPYEISRFQRFPHNSHP